MNGLVNADISIAKKMDVSFVDENGVIKGSTKSSIIPFETDKSGFPTKRSSVTTSGGFDNICTYASQKMSELGKEIVEGKAQVDPYKLGDKTACDYCEYNGICRFDVKLPGNHYRALKKMQQDDAIDAMVKRLEEEEE